MSNRHLIRRTLSFFWPYRWRIVLAFFSMLLVAPCAAATAKLVQYVVDEVLIAKDTHALYLSVWALVVLMAFKGVFRFLQTYIMNTTGLRVLENLRNQLYAKVIRLPMHFYEESQVGMLMSRILNDVAQIRQSMPSFVMLIREVFTILGLIGYVFYLDPYLAFWAVVVLPLAIWPFIYFGKKLRKYGRRSQANISDVNVTLQETFSGVRVIKTFANERAESQRFVGENHNLTGTLIRQILYSESSSRVMELIGAGGVALALWYGGMRVIEGHMTSGSLVSFLAALGMLYEPIKKMNSCNIDIQRALAGAERVFEIFDSTEIVEEGGGTLPMPETFSGVEIDHVTFSYPECVRPALDNINLSVESGRRVALVGPSGSGKTTLVSLIPRFYDPQQGEIRISGHDVRQYSLDQLRLSLGMVSQDTFLFNASIHDNIAYGHENIPREEVERAARAAFAHDFITDLPEGYETVVGERGVRLSGGQKQRLTIARALLKNPQLLILDEATSALDTEAERIVQLALENLMRDRTSIVIAHRLSTVLSADMIVVMEGGRIISKGRHEDLLGKCELYTRLYNMQFEDSPEKPDDGFCQL